ncbi:hypothetical protein Pyrfu_0490 [Pyrolobus fumarii 1A]|uniref:Uncharacterized protein n=1 Tax=Pyrolobus fumarii (strain DSM 11204 / 1A) TaxID=694429 RepID=G0EGI7_PYRF1|nr:hypothetical protein Pyrfu_0490 [Pyrolobus fumarii 1A]
MSSLDGVETGRLPRDAEAVIGSVLGGASVVAVAAGCVGRESRLSFISCILRLAEEYGVDGVVVLATPRTRPDSERALRVVSDAGVAIPGVIVEVSDAPGILERAARRLVEYLAARFPRVVSCTSPGSRRLAAALALASVTPGSVEGSEANVVHLDFWWGPWTGLPYPLVPRPLEPLYVIHPVWEPPRGREAPKWLRKLRVRELLESVGVEAGSLRACIAVKALQVNIECSGTARYDYDRAECTPCVLSLETPLGEITVDDWCKPESWVKAAEDAGKLASSDKGIPGLVVRALAEASGLYWWLAGSEDGRGEALLYTLGDRLLVDANLVYKGVHIEALMGASIALPWAVVAEIERSLAEALKRNAGLRDPEKVLRRIVAGVLLRELQATTPVLPSDPPPADTAMIRMDPLILEKYTLVTEDTGAYTLWRSHPSSKITRVLSARQSLEPWRWDEIDVRARAARAAYALLHVACLAEKTRGMLRGTNAWQTIGIHLEKFKIKTRKHTS